jgi:hypothetical protein
VFQAIHYKITAADLQQLTGGIKREDPQPPPQQQQNQHQQQQIRAFSLADSSTALMMQDYSSGAMVNHRLAAQRAEEDYFRQCSGSTGSTCFLASRIRIH